MSKHHISNSRLIIISVLVFNILIVSGQISTSTRIEHEITPSQTSSLALTDKRVSSNHFTEHINLQRSNQFTGGTGTMNDPFLVGTVDDLNNVRLFLYAHFRQIADINLDISPWNQGFGWLPIGSETNKFTGSYDGNGFEIKNMFINRPTATYVGLFGYVKGTVIRNLTLTDAFVSGYRLVGGIAGIATANSQFEYVRVLNIAMFLVERYCGALLGHLDDGTVFRCSSTGTIVRGDYYFWNSIGGLIGAMNSSTLYTGSYVSECFSIVKLVSGSHNSYGGLVGGLWKKGEIKDCYARGPIHGTNARAGGISCDVTLGPGPKRISNCYSTCIVNAPGEDVRGFMGYTDGEAIFSGNFWDIQTSGQSEHDVAATGKTTAEMKDISTYLSAGWDFENIWIADTIGNVNDGYPYLRWFIPTPICPPPIDLIAVDIEFTTAQLQWIPAGTCNEWQMAYGLQGFEPGNGGTLVEGLVLPNYQLTDLIPGTNYTFYAKSVCDNNSLSVWTGPISFKTKSIYAVAGGGQYCKGMTPSGVSVFLNGSDTSTTYFLFKDGLELGQSKIGTGDTLQWHNLMFGDYIIKAESTSGFVQMGGMATISEYLPVIQSNLPPDFVCLEEQPFILDLFTPAGGDYQGNGVLNNVFIPSTAGRGTHTIKYFYSDASGCSNADSMIVFVKRCQMDSVGSEALISVFPNPTHDQLYIKVAGSLNNIMIHLYNQLGQCVLSFGKIDLSKTVVLDVAQLTSGVYVFRIASPQLTYSKKIIKF